MVQLLIMYCFLNKVSVANTFMWTASKKNYFKRAVLFLQSLHKLKAVTTCVPRSERKDSVTRTNIKKLFMSGDHFMI